MKIFEIERCEMMEIGSGILIVFGLKRIWQA